jgi:SPP1 family predicted phage head-tail adaptor
MQAGLLNEVIELQQLVTVKDAYGSEVESYEYYCQTKAQVIYSSGNKLITNNEVNFNYNTTFNIRYYIEVTETMRIKFQSRLYRILSIEQDKKLQKKTIITELIHE